MVKSIFLFFICVFSLAVGSPCYSGCCSSRPVKKESPDNREAERLLAARSIRRSTSPDRRASPPPSVIVNETSGARRLPSSSSKVAPDSTEIVPFGRMQLVIPADVTIGRDERGNQVITLPAVCCMIVFDEVRKAIRENTTVKRLHESTRNQILERDDLDTKLGITFGDMRAAADQGGGSAEPIIRTLGDFIDEITKGTDGAIPDDIIIKWERHKTSFAGRILLVKDGKGLFISTNPTVKSDQ